MAWASECQTKCDIEIINVDEIDDIHPLSVPIEGTNAYVIYTSGSTGEPKGVLVSRKSLNKFLEWSIGFYKVREGERWAQFSNLSFDLSLVDLLTCLSSGGILVTGPSKHLPGRFIRDLSVNIWHSTPVMIESLYEHEKNNFENLKTLRIASFCGGVLNSKKVINLLSGVPNLEIVNAYGPTEATLFCSVQRIDKEMCDKFDDGLPIGEPIPGWNFDYDAVKDREGIYELIIISDYIAEGYISQSQKDTNPFRKYSGTRCYKTGDLVEKSGEHLLFYGRNDDEVKIRGNRVNLKEFERHVNTLSVKHCKAVYHEDKGVFLFIETDNKSITAEKIKRVLDDNLQKRLLSGIKIKIIEGMPLNASSKIDTSRLRCQISKGVHDD